MNDINKIKKLIIDHKTTPNPLTKKINTLNFNDISQLVKEKVKIVRGSYEEIDRSKNVIQLKPKELSEIISCITESNIQNLEQALTHIYYDMLLLSKQDFDYLMEIIKNDKTIHQIFLRFMDKNRLQFNFLDIKVTKENLLDIVENRFIPELNNFNIKQQSQIAEHFFTNNFELIKSLNEEMLNKFEELLRHNHLIWNNYYYNIKESNNPPETFVVQESPLSEMHKNYLMENCIYKTTHDTFEITPEILNDVKVKIERKNGYKFIFNPHKKQKKQKQERDFYDYVKMFIVFFDFKTHYNKTKTFILNKIKNKMDSINYKIGKILFLASLDKKQRDAVKKFSFDYRNLDQSSAIVKYVMRKNPGIFEDIANKKIKQEKKEEKRKQFVNQFISELDNSKNNRLLFE